LKSSQAQTGLTFKHPPNFYTFRELLEPIFITVLRTGLHRKGSLSAVEDDEGEVVRVQDAPPYTFLYGSESYLTPTAASLKSLMLSRFTLE